MNMVATSSPAAAPAWFERRQSVRFPADDEAQVEFIDYPGLTLSGFLRDVSQNGMRVALPEKVRNGARVKISVATGHVVEGGIRYCRSAGSVYYAGVSIRAVLSASVPGPGAPA